MAEVFISYSRADEALAKRVEKALTAAGFEAWRDDQLPAHRAYSEIIEQRLRSAAAVVVLWSKESAQSQWVRAEADFARNEVKLVQATLDQTLPPMPFNQIQCADLKGWRGNVGHAGWAKLLSSIRTVATGERPPAKEVSEQAWWRRFARPPLAIAIGLALLLLAGALVGIKYWGGDELDRPVLAVLPFTSLDARDESLVAGMWEDTRHALSTNPNLLVLGPNTSEELAKKGIGATSKAADYVLRASVRSVGDRVRINSGLVRTSDGAEVWSEKFDRKLDDVFALQSEIASDIEGRIRGRLATGKGTQPQNIATTGEVYALYNDGRAKLRKRQVGRYGEAYQQLEQVVQKDPNFAPGWATLAILKHLGGATLAQKSTSSAEADARRAITLAPNLGTAHAALGFVLGDGPVAQAQLRRAIALDPNDFEAMNWLASTLLMPSQAREKLRLYDKIVEIEPLWWPAIFNKIHLLFTIGDVRGAEAEQARLEKLGATNLLTMLKMSTLELKGDLSAAIALGIGFYRKAGAEDRAFIATALWQPLLQLGYFEIADNLSTPPSPAVPYIRKNDPRALDMIEAGVGPRQFWAGGPLPTVVGRVYLLNNQGPRLAKLYRAIASTPEEFRAIVGKHRLAEVAPTAALALRSVGDDQQARLLLELAERDVAQADGREREQQIALARIRAVQGKADEAIAILSSAVRAGWLPPYLPIHTDLNLDPPFAELKANPRFQQLREQILGHLAKERAELGAITLE